MNGDEPEKRTTDPAQASTDPQEPQRPPAAPEPDSPWQYKAADSQPASMADDTQPQTAPSNAAADVTWTASEFIAHNKGIGWYLALGACTIVLDVLLFLWTRDVFTAVVLPVFAILFGIIAARKPRVMEYRLNGNGLFIGGRFYPYNDFKSFSIMDEGAFSSIMFLPVRRFMPSVSVYYEPKDEERVLQVLAQYLPMEHREHDLADKLARRIRF